MTIGKLNFKMTPARKVLLFVAALTLVLIVYRLVIGLRPFTNLNNDWPWGLWIAVDLSAVALAGGGYSLTLMAHVLNIRKFKVVARRAMLVSLLTYIFVLLVLFVEIGRWYNFWRPFVSWGHHSPLFEVFVCIAAYTLVQFVEFTEVATEKVATHWHKFLKKIMPVVVIIAAILPFGHQASLGAIYLATIDRMHGLWATTMIPWLFLISSFFVGPAVVTLETLAGGRIFNHKVSIDVLRSLIRVSGWLMIAYLVLKIGDVASRGVLPQVFSGSFEGNMFLLEMVAGVIVPIVICFSPLSNTKGGLAAFGLLTSAGVVLNRVNVVFTSLVDFLGNSYSPSWGEWAISIGALAIIALAYLFIMENFNFAGHDEHQTAS